MDAKVDGSVATDSTIVVANAAEIAKVLFLMIWAESERLLEPRDLVNPDPARLHCHSIYSELFPMMSTVSQDPLQPIVAKLLRSPPGEENQQDLRQILVNNLTAFFIGMFSCVTTSNQGEPLIEFYSELMCIFLKQECYYPEVALLLFQHGANPVLGRINKPISLAAQLKSTEMLEHFLKGQEFDSVILHDALTKAIHSGHLAAIKLLLECKNHSRTFLRTAPLFCLESTGNKEEIMRFLFQDERIKDTCIINGLFGVNKFLKAGEYEAAWIFATQNGVYGKFFDEMQKLFSKTPELKQFLDEKLKIARSEFRNGLRFFSIDLRKEEEKEPVPEEFMLVIENYVEGPKTGQ
jgi:hypothetical protein